MWFSITRQDKLVEKVLETQLNSFVLESMPWRSLPPDCLWYQIGVTVCVTCEVFFFPALSQGDVFQAACNTLSDHVLISKKLPVICQTKLKLILPKNAIR